MNRTFKVVFSKARGAMVVASEAAVSTKKKGTKTVVAAAVTMMLSGMAAATEFAGNITEDQTWTAGDSITQVVIQDGADVTLTGSVANQDRESNFTVTGGSVTVGNGGSDLGLFVGGDFKIQGGEVTVTGTTAGGQNQAGEITKALATVGGYDNFSMSGGVLNLNDARAWVGSWTSSETGETTFNDMVFSGGTVNLKNGGLTGMSGTDAAGNVIGTQVKINGTATVNVLSGANNVINAVAVNLSDEATIDVSAGSTLQISTYNKDGLAWENPYDNGPAGKFTMDGGTITNNGVLTVRNDFVVNGGTVNVGQSGSLEVRNVEINGGQFNVVGSEGSVGGDNGSGRTLPAFGAYNTFVMNDGEVTLANGGRLWIGTSSKSDPNSYNRMELKGGKIALNGNGWITGNKRLITEANSDGNHSGASVLGYNTIGFDGVEVEVNGESNTIDAVRTELTAGSLTINAGGTLNVRATTSTNQPEEERQEALLAIEDASAFVVSGGSLNIAETGKLTFENEIERLEIVGGTVTNNGLIEAEKATHGDVQATDLTVTIGQGGHLNTSIFQDNFQVNNVEVNEGGVFNISALNSKTNNDLKENDRLLIAFGNNWTLNGGELLVAGSNYQNGLKVGASDTSGTLTVASGSYTYSTLEVAKKGTVNVEGGELNVTNLAFSAGNENNVGKVTVGNNGSLNIDGTLTAGGAADGSLVNDGTLKLNYSNFFESSVGEDGAPNWSTTDNVALVSGTGVIDLTGVTGEYTLDDLKKTQAVFGDGLQIMFSEGTLKLGEGEDLTSSSIDGLHLADQVGEATDGVFAVNDDTTLAGVNFGNSDTASVSAGDGKVLTLDGGASDVFTFDPSSEVTTVEAKNLQLGTSAASSGNINVQTLKISGTFDVVGSYIAQEVEVNTSDTSITGALDTQILSGSGKTTVENNGVLTVGLLNADVELTNDGTLVLGTVPPQNPNARVDVDQPQVNGKVIIGGASGNDNILTTNHSAGEALRGAINDGKFGEGTEAFNGFYVDKTVSVGDTGYIQIGNVGQREGGIAVGSDVVTVINMGAFSSGDVIFDASNVAFNFEGKGYLSNLYSVKNVTLVNGTNEISGAFDHVFESSNAFLDVQFKDVAADPEAGTSDHTDLIVSINDDVTTDAGLKGALGSVLAEGANLDNQKVLAAIGSSSSGFVNENGQLTSDGVRATKEYMVAPVTAGAYNMAYDSMELISNALIQRNLDSKKGLGVWADVFYGSNESDSLYGDSGYSSDIYGGMLGVDFGFGEGARVGAALSIGSGDGDSEGSVSKYSTDSDFWGLSVYAGKDFGGLTFTGDMSYLWLDNDIGGSVAGASASESLDSTVFSLGVRADWKAYEGKVLQVVPHAGVRWASIDVDDYRGLSMDKMNVIEMPIGVTVKGVFETASGWQVAPEIDFTAAPQIGDTEVETIIGDVDVIDNVYNASIGVNAGTDAVRFGLSYKYGFGNDGRSNNTFNLKASYLF